MRAIALSLAAVFNAGLILLASTAIASDRVATERRLAKADEMRAAVVDHDRLWYGGVLAPIVVEATAPEGLRTVGRTRTACLAGEV